MKRWYVVRAYSCDCCYKSACLSSLKKAKHFIAGSPYATITACDDAYYGDNFSGWHAVGNCVEVNTGRKCDQ